MYEVGVFIQNGLRKWEFTPSLSESDRRKIMNFIQAKSYQILNLIENFSIVKFSMDNRNKTVYVYNYSHVQSNLCKLINR